MAWTAPNTAIAHTIYTAAEYNLYTRDNLSYLKVEMDGNPRALATTTGQYPVATGTNSLVMRSAVSAASSVDVSVVSLTYNSTTSVLSVTATTGATALVLFGAQMTTSGASPNLYSSVAVSGATTIAASDSWAIIRQSDTGGYTIQMGSHHLFTTLTPGSNTFTMQHRSTGPVTLNLDNREITVIPY